MSLSALARGNASDHFGAVLQHLLGMIAAFFAGKSLYDYFRMLVDQNAHDNFKNLRLFELRKYEPHCPSGPRYLRRFRVKLTV